MKTTEATPYSATEEWPDRWIAAVRSLRAIFDNVVMPDWLNGVGSQEEAEELAADLRSVSASEQSKVRVYGRSIKAAGLSIPVWLVIISNEDAEGRQT